MKNKALKRIIIWMSILLLLAIIAFAGYKFALNYAGKKAMNMLVSNQIEGMLESGEISIEEVAEIAAPEVMEEKEPEEIVQTAPQQAEQTPTPPTDKATEKVPKKTTETKKEVVKSASKKITDAITREEKEAVLKLISSRLTAADIKYISGLFAGGLDSKEGSKAAKLAYSKFTAEEIAQIKDLWHKYKSFVFTGKPKE